MLRCCTFSCASTHTSCYAAARSLALPHVRHATLLHVLLRFHTYVMLRCCTFSCTSTHTSCYAAARFLALPHVRHATLLHVLVHFHTYIMLRARRARYADACKALDRSLQTTSASNGKTLPTTAVSLWSSWEEAHKKEFFFGRNAGFGQTVGWLKARFPGSWTHTKIIKVADKISEKIGSTCMLQSGARASKAMSWRTSGNFVLERKKGTFWRNPRRTKLLFRACKTLDFPLLKWPFQGICTRKCINCYSFGHFPHRDGTVWCHHRHGLLQMLLPYFSPGGGEGDTRVCIYIYHIIQHRFKKKIHGWIDKRGNIQTTWMQEPLYLEVKTPVSGRFPLNMSQLKFRFSHFWVRFFPKFLLIKSHEKSIYFC